MGSTGEGRELLLSLSLALHDDFLLIEARGDPWI